MKLTHLATALCLACSFANGALAADTLRFGLEAQYPLFESKSSTGELQGLDIDVGNARVRRREDAVQMGRDLVRRPDSRLAGPQSSTRSIRR